MAIEEKEGQVHVAFEEYEAFDPSAPEKSLLKAVLLSALNDLKKPGESRRKATEFFLSKEDDYIFSFVSICQYLSVDPSKVLTVTGLLDLKPSTEQEVKAEADS